MILPPCAALEHVAARGAAQPEHAREVDREHLVPERVVVIGGRLAADDAGVVDEDVEPAEALRSRRRRRAAPIAVSARSAVSACGAAARGAAISAAVADGSARAPCSDDVGAGRRPAQWPCAAPSPREAPVTSAALPSRRNRSSDMARRQRCRRPGRNSSRIGEKMSISTTSSSSIVAPCSMCDGKCRTSPATAVRVLAVDR